MVKLKTFEIILSAPDGLLMAGEILEGYVTVDLKYPMKMQGKNDISEYRCIRDLTFFFRYEYIFVFNYNIVLVLIVIPY